MTIVGVLASAVFAFQAGQVWNYDLSVLGQTGTLTQSVVSASGGRAQLAISASLAGSTTSAVEVWESNDSGIFKISGAQGTFEPPLPVYKKTVTEWTWTGTLAEANAKAVVRVLPESALATPAGRFWVCKIDIAIETPRGSTISRYWLSQDAGFVRIENDLPGGSVQLLLRSRKP